MANPASGGKNQDVSALHRAYHRRLLKFFFVRVGDFNEAEDLTQEIFVQMARRVSDEPIQDTDHFIFRSASNLLRDRARRSAARHRGAHVSLSAAPDEPVDSKIPAALVEDRGPERVLIARERLKEVLRRLDELGERTRTIFILFRVEGMKQREIALRLGVSVPTVEKHVIRAMAHLSRCFADPSQGDRGDEY